MSQADCTATSKPGQEEWRPVVGHETAYHVSSWGRVRSLKRTVRSGNGYREVPELILSPASDKDGYERVRLNGRPWLVHRLVATAFIPNPNNKPEVNHINGDPSNSRLENLEWATKSENALHAARIGLVDHSLKYLENRLDKDLIKEIMRYHFQEGKSFRELAPMFNLHRKSLARMVRRLSEENYYTDDREEERE